MTIYVGEVVTIIAAAINPVTQTVIDDASGAVEFYAPGKNPAKVPDDRQPEMEAVPLTFDAAVINKDGTQGAYVGYVPTADWTPGKWTYRAILTGSYETWEYGSFTLAP